MQPHSRKLASWAIWIGGLSVAVLLPLGHTLAQDDKPRSEPQTTEKKETPDPTPPPPAAEGDSVPVYKKFGNVQFNTTGTQLPPVVDESGVAFGLRSTALEERRRPVRAVALSPDGKRLVTVGGGLKIWDVATAKVLVSVRESETARVAFSPDGKHLATADAKGGLHLRDPATGQVRKSLGRHDPAVHALAFSPDHKLLASSALGAVRLWDVASGKELKELSGHSGLTSSLSFARDGKFLAAGSGSEVRVWELPKGKVVTTIRTPFPVRSAALSPDGKAIATVGSNPTPTLWSVETGKPFGDLKEEKDGIQAYPRGIAETVAFAPNGKIIATAQGAGRVILWDAKTRKEIATFGFEPENPERAYFGVMADPVTRPTTPVATSANTALAFSADGTRLAVNHGMVAVVIDVVKRAHLGKFPRDGAGPQPVLALAYAPDGKTLAVALEDHSVSVREVDTGEELLRLRGHGDKVTCLVFAPDGRTLATGSADNTVKVWDAANGQVRLTFKGHTSWVYAVAFAPSGKTIASGGYDRVIRLWNATTGKEQGVLAGHKGAVRALAFTADGATLASGGADRTIKLWNIAGAAREFAVFDGHKATVRALAFTRNGQTLVSASDDGTAKSWDVVQRKERFTFKGHSDAVIAVAVAPTGTRVATASLTDKVLHVWDALTSMGSGRSLGAHYDSVTALAFAPDGHTIATGSYDRTVRLWPAVTVPVRVFNKHKAAVGFAVFSPDGRQVLSGGGGAPDPKQKTPPRLDPFGMGHGDHLGHDLHLWDFETGKVQRRLTGHTDRVHAAAIAPDGRQALSAGHDGTIRRWDLTTGKTLGVLKGHEKAIRAVAYSPKGPLAVSGGDDHTVRLWDVQAGKQVRLLKGHTKEVRTVAFSPDGRRIASGGRDGVVRVWDVAGGAPLALSNHVAIESVVWFRDGKRVLCAGEGQMRIWDAQEGKVVGTVGGHGARTDRVALLPGERMAVSVGQDGTARFWNLADGREITRWELAPVIPSTSVPSPPRGIYPPAVAAEAPAEAKEVEGKELQPPPAVGGLPPLPPGGRPAVTAPDWTYALSVSPDGRHLVTAGGFSQNAGSSFVNYPTLGERSTMPVPPPPAGVSSPPVQSSRSTMIRIWKVPAVETPAP